MENFIISLDLGTDTINLVAAQIDEKYPYGIKVFHQESKDSLGIKRGSIENVEKVQKIINDIMMGTEKKIKKAGPSAKWYIANVSGLNYRTNTTRYSSMSSGSSINEVFLKKLMDNAQATTQLSSEEEVTRFNPIGYSLDNSSTITINPTGMTANRIEGNYLAHITKRRAIDTINMTMKNAKLNCVYTNAAAKSVLMLTNDEKKAGVALVDLGAGTTNVLICSRNVVLHECSIPFGSDTITNDIAIGLQKGRDEAEIIKRVLGLNGAAISQNKKKINLTIEDQNTEVDIQLNDFITRARVDEIIRYVDSALKQSRLTREIKSMVLVGGGAGLKGIDEAFKEYFEMPVRIGTMPKTSIEATEKLSTALGMAILFAQENKHLFKKKENSLFDEPATDSPENKEEQPDVKTPETPKAEKDKGTGSKPNDIPQEKEEKEKKSSKWYDNWVKTIVGKMDDGGSFSNFAEEKKD